MLGAQHPAHVTHSMVCIREKGYYLYTEINMKNHKIGPGYLIKDDRLIKNITSTSYDLSYKSINSTGSFTHYNAMTSDFIMLKDYVIGTKKQVLILHKSLLVQAKWLALETDLKFIHTTSKFNHACFQTAKEKEFF